MERIQHLVPASDGGDDGVWVFGPMAGPRVGVGLGEEAFDGGLERDQGMKDAAFQASLGELGEEPLDRIQPGCRGRGEMEGPARVPVEPFDDLRVLVHGVVVDDGMHQLAGRHFRLDGIEEADELLVPVSLHAAADDLARGHVQGREQRGGAIPDVVVGHGAAAAALERQSWLGAVEGLDLALLVDRQHHRMGRWIDVEADDVADLVGEAGIVRELELPHPVRLQAMGAPDALHRADADAAGLGHRRRRPMRGLAGRVGERQLHHPRDDLRAERRDARRAGLVAQQAIDAGPHEPLLPAPDGGLGHPRLAHDLGRAEPFGGQQHDPGAPDVLLRAVAVADDGEQSLTVDGGDVQADPGAHAPDSHAAPRRGNPFRILMSGFIH